MNLSKKIGASAGVVGVVVTIMGNTFFSSYDDPMRKWGSSVGAGGGLSALGGATAVIDKYVNQNITNNKVAQYGLTALEGLLVHPTVFFICTGKAEYTEYLQNLKSDAESKIITSSIILSALTFKFIWDSENSTIDDITTPELDLVEVDGDSINTAFDTAAPIDSSDGYQVF